MKCPRCGTDFTGFPALSRWDNLTEICSSCGTDEAMLQFTAAPGKHQEVLDPIQGTWKWATS